MAVTKRYRITKKLLLEKISQGLNWCSVCRKFLSFNQFYKHPTSTSGYGYRCKNCSNRLAREYRKNPANSDIVKRNRRQTRNHHRKRKNLFVELAGKCCQRCGYDEFIAGLCFHHVDPEQKDTKISQLTRASLKDAKIELDKCILLCQNCHFALHGNEWDAEFVKRDGIGWTIKQFELSSRAFS